MIDTSIDALPDPFLKAYRIKRFPFVIVALLFWSLVISIITQINPLSYDIFYEKTAPLLKWSWLTSIFVHGLGDLPSLVDHLWGNAFVALVFGIVTEKIFSSGRTLLLVGLSIMGGVLYFYLSGNYGHGASLVTFAFLPIALFLLVYRLRQRGWRACKHPVLILAAVFSLGLGMIGGIIVPALTHSNIGGTAVHSIAFLCGTLCCLTWRDDLANWSINPNPSTPPWSKPGREDWLAGLFILAVSAYLAWVLLAGLPAEIDQRQWLKAELSGLPPATGRAQLNANKGQILISFEEEMIPAIHSYHVSINTSNLTYPLEFSWKWLDTRTLYVKLNQPLDEHFETFRLNIYGIKTRSGAPDREVEIAY